jgi:orotidine-5'-phosphate decarboxylase
VLGTSSREILGAGPRIQDLRDAALRTLEELRAA